MAPNKTLVFLKVPTGFPVPGEHLAVETRDIDLDSAPAGTGLLLEILYASFDPFLRGCMRDPKIQSCMPAFEVGQPIVNSTVSRVLKAGGSHRVSAFQEGDLVIGMTPITQYARLDAGTDDKADLIKALRKINNPRGFDLGLFLGPLGLPGLTAWSGLHAIGRPVAGETLFVSSAAGAVCQVVGQLAKQLRLKTIGSVGSDEKLAFITDELGFDAGFNYNKEKPLDALRRLAPQGIDIYFDNVGGGHLDAALKCMKSGVRIPLCGMISDYNLPPDQQHGVKNLGLAIKRQLKLQCFLVLNPEFGPAYTREHQQKLQAWLADGSFKARLAITDGIDNAAEGLVGIFRGQNFGKAVLRVRDGGLEGNT